MPTIATSHFSTSRNSGNLANVDGPANLGTFVPLTGCIVFLFFFKVLLFNHNFFLYESPTLRRNTVKDDGFYWDSWTLSPTPIFPSSRVFKYIPMSKWL